VNGGAEYWAFLVVLPSRDTDIVSTQRIGEIPVSLLTLNRLEKFRKQQLTEISERKGRPVKPSTINRDVANLRAMLNKGLDHLKIESNPIDRIKQLEENNVRERILSSEEF
jgi:hypothetical protein